MTDDDINNVFKFYTDYKDVVEKVKIVTISDVREKGYTLAVNNYIEKMDKKLFPAEIRRQYFEAFEEMLEAEDTMRKLLWMEVMSMSKRITIEELQTYGMLLYFFVLI